jgi:AraC-like DNA-binding protein
MRTGTGRDFKVAVPRKRRTIYVVGSKQLYRDKVAAVLAVVGDELRYCRNLAVVRASTIRENPSVAVLVDDGDPEVCSPASLRAFRSQEAATAIFLATSSHSRTLHELAAFARAGLDGAYLIDHKEDLDQLRRVAARHLTNALPSSLVHEVIPVASAEVQSLFTLCIRVGDRPHSADAIANWLQWDRKTVYRRLRDARQRPLHDLLNLGRLLHVALKLDDRSIPVSRIARHLSFANVSTLRRLCKRETGYTPRELRDRGAVRTVLAAIRARE